MSRHRVAGQGTRLAGIVTTVVMVVMMAGAGLAVTSRIAGVRVLVEHSDSMAPAIHTGDVVLSRAIPAERAAPGDVVTFPDLTRGGELVTHRVTEVRRYGDVLAFTTRGDANPAAEQWTATRGATIGRTVGVVPGAGVVMTPLTRPAVAAGLNGLLVATLVLLAVRRRRSPAVPPRR